MKKIKYFVLIMFALLIFPKSIKAASISVSCSSSNIYVGDSVTCSVMGSSTQVSGANGGISYSGNLSFVSANKIKCGLGDVTASSFNCTDDVTSGSLTFASYVFTATSAGTATVSITNPSVVDETWNEVPVAGASYTITVNNRPSTGGGGTGGGNITNNPTPTPIPTPAKDTTLSSISIENVSFEFKKDVYSYNLNVNYDVDSIKIDYKKSDDKQNVTIDGSKTLKTGLNVIKLNVKNGTESATYVLNITKREEYQTVSSTELDKFENLIKDGSNSKIILEYKNTNDNLLLTNLVKLINENKRTIVFKVYKDDKVLYEVLIEADKLENVDGYLDLNILLNSNKLALNDKYYNFNLTQKSSVSGSAKVKLFNNLLTNDAYLYKIKDGEYIYIDKIKATNEIDLELDEFANYVLVQNKISGAKKEKSNTNILVIILCIFGILLLCDGIYMFIKSKKKLIQKTNEEIQ